MKVSLIVVQGKPEGKVIPLTVPRFRIGRGEGCHLRPNNEQVSRNHAEIQLDEDRVVVRDLGSRNGTLVNHKRLEPQTDHVLANKDLVQVGPLTFAVSIQGMPAAASASPASDPSERAMDKAASLDELSNDQIDAWLVGENEEAVPERPSGVYSGDTMSFQSFQEASKSDHEVQPVPPKQEQRRREEDEPEEPEPAEEEDEPEEEPIYDSLDEDDEANEEDTDLTEMPEEFVDESNPFYAAKRQSQDAESKPKAADHADSSQAAEDILRKMMERRRAGQ